MKTILVVASSGQASLSTIKCLRLANLSKPKYRIITSDIDPLLIGSYIGDKGYLVEKETDKWINCLNEIITKENVDLVIAAHDIPLEMLSERRNEIKTRILLPSKNVVRLSRDKFMLSQWLRENRFPYPKTWKSDDLNILKMIKFPVIIKPRNGFGSRFVFDCSNYNQLVSMLEYSREHGFESIVQEKLEGTELSGMATVAKDGEILSITCAESVKKFGMSYKTIHGSEEDDLDFKLLVAKIIGKLHAIGPLSVQGFRHNGQITIFELNARFTGAQIVRAVGGVNSPEILADNWLNGVKSYPIVRNKFVALWYTDYGYILYEDYLELKNLHKTEKKSIGAVLL